LPDAELAIFANLKLLRPQFVDFFQCKFITVLAEFSETRLT